MPREARKKLMRNISRNAPRDKQRIIYRTSQQVDGC